MNLIKKENVKEILIIACDNGLGHVKRSIILADQLIFENYNVDLVCSQKKFKKFCQILKISKKLNNIDIKINFMTKDENLELRVKVLKKFLHVNKYDLVISDNLIEVLFLRPDAVILANFWWHDVIDYKKETLFSFKKILDKCDPITIGSELFATKGVKKNKNFKSIGFITKNIYQGKKKNSFRNLLISVGASGISLDLYKSFFSKHLNLLKKEFNHIYCDPILVNGLNLDSSLIIADYSQEMYKKINVAIVRPGLGTIIDLLSNQCVPICIYEKNSEMINNGKIIENNKIGFNFGIVNEENIDLLQFLNEVKIKIDIIKYNILSLNMNGLNEAIVILKNEIKKYNFKKKNKNLS